jgi:hypothetical protein
MKLRRLAVLGFAALFLSTVGCKTDEQGADAANPVTPAISASATSISAIPASSVTITVSSGKAPITLSTTLGTFANATRTTTLGAVPGSAVITPCDARVSASCAGTAVVTASTSEFTSNSLTVVFTGFEDCGNGVDDNGDGIVDCADPQCPLNQPCSTTNLVCSSTQQCNKCMPPGGVTVEASREVTCTDGGDNDCDGAVDCDDSDCADVTCRMATTALGVCSGGACVCNKTEGTETTCGDGMDNDCDLVADCDDTDCVGKTCNAAGMQCTGLIPTSTCAYCPTGATETGAQCGDGKDNDCDGKADCYDAGCQPTTVGGTDGQQCNPFGGKCMLTMGVPSCGCTTGATSETSCSGGVDDDCDGRVDCADTDCQPVASGLLGPSCGPNGVTCTSAGACECPGGDVELCDNYDLAGVAVDDNCDGRANCQDFSCRPVAAGEPGEDCSSVGEFGKACTAAGACTCTGNGGTAEVAESTCDDGTDNDCDFLIDCEDPDCSTPSQRVCGPGGATCSATVLGSCVCTAGTTEQGTTACSDGVDNNCNGLKDCEEAACASVTCSGTFPSYICISGACADPATQYGVKVTPARARIPSDGVASTAVEIEVTQKGVAKPGVTVALTLPAPVLGTLLPASVVTDSQGRATATFTSTGSAGVQTILATVQGVGAKGTGTVTLPSIGEIRILANGGVLYDVMGVKNSGFQEQNLLAVEILDTEAKTYPDGLTVTFEHQRLGGSTLADPVACAGGVVNCVATTAATDNNGLARVRLYSGTVAGVVGVNARATAGGITRLFQLPSIAIVGAKPNAGHFSMVCGTVNIPAYSDYDCHVSMIDAPFTCAAFLKDRYNNILGRATTVSFLSEAGAVGQPAVTPAYDPGADPVGQADLGTAVEIINTLGAKLPKDVTPNVADGEGSVTTAPDACGVATRNPRDGVTTVVAWTPGEEAYYDSNGNGAYDAGEPFVDLPEPFVDYDDDDTRDGDEPFIDTNGNGTWNNVNGVWDSDTNIWTKTLVVYTGMPAFMRSDASGTEKDYLSRWMDPDPLLVPADLVTFPNPTPVRSFAVSPMFQPDPYYDCNTSGRYDIAVQERWNDLPPENGVYDPGEPIVDCNANGIYDGPPNFPTIQIVPESYTDANGDGSYTPTVTPATGDTLVVTASDRNLNRLSAEAKYSVSIPSEVGFTAEYLGEPSIPDRRGFAFGYQPCNSVTPTSCALDCADVAPPGGHCVMRTRVSDFSHGYAAYVNFRGGPSDSADGPTEAYWEIELFGEIMKIVVQGTHQ